MKKQILGIHHITAIAGDPQTNLDFYAGVLGLRLVKLTVNFDDPGTYHLYYGDGVGHPGTILTFFPWPHAPKGRRGTGQVTETAFAIPEHAIDFWTARLAEHRVAFKGPFRPVWRTSDFVLRSRWLGNRTHRQQQSARDDRAYQAGPVPLEFAVRGFHSATLSQADHRETAALLTDTMGFKLVAQDGDRFRYAVDSGEPAGLVDVLRCAGREAGPRLSRYGSPHRLANSG